MNDQELLENLQDARAYHEKEYQWEKQHEGRGGSRIAMGQARRYADAIAIAAIRLGNRATERPHNPTWMHWAILGACIAATVVLVIVESH